MSALHCHQCENRDFDRCRLTDLPIHIHAAQHFCPVGKFRRSLPQLIAHYAAGAIKVAAVAIGIDQTPPDALTARKAACDQCRMQSENNPKCGLCGCTLNKKQRKNSEQCPAGKWPPKAARKLFP